MTLPLFTACSDDDSGDGAPEVSVATIAPALRRQYSPEHEV